MTSANTPIDECASVQAQGEPSLEALEKIAPVFAEWYADNYPDPYIAALKLSGLLYEHGVAQGKPSVTLIDGAMGWACPWPNESRRFTELVERG